MWQYEYNNELYHYGVKGMKWGHRRARMQEARSAYRSAKNRAFSKYEKDIHGIEKGYKRGQMLSKKDQAREAAVEKRYSSDVARAKSNYKQAKQQIRSDFKTAKTERKQALKETYKEINKKTSVGEKLLWNNATRKLAAKYVVDKNMSMDDARKKANGVAKRNTAIFLGAYGAMTVADMYMRNKR